MVKSILPSHATPFPSTPSIPPQLPVLTYLHIVRHREDFKARKVLDQEDPEVARLREDRNVLLKLVETKITSPSVTEMQPLVCDLNTRNRAVFLVMTTIEFGKFELSKSTYKLLAKHVGMSLESICHWALCVIDRGFGFCYCYELMSDQLALNTLGKNYFRVFEITPEFIASWNSCYYVGETTKSHEEVQALGQHYMSLHPRYNLIKANCQDLVESLVKELCHGSVIHNAKLSEEIRQLTPKISMDLMIARLRSKMELTDAKEDSNSVQEDMDVINHFWKKVKRRSQDGGKNKTNNV
ncbi:hypothetical protein F5X96DRAFT_639127 [Biscogniauxia mediterranea]|nr:hypothetical protein F5X96DRAFT_639127 [Biscogniauxia mediterranea]